MAYVDLKPSDWVYSKTPSEIGGKSVYLSSSKASTIPGPEFSIWLPPGSVSFSLGFLGVPGTVEATCTVGIGPSAGSGVLIGSLASDYTTAVSPNTPFKATTVVRPSTGFNFVIGAVYNPISTEAATTKTGSYFFMSMPDALYQKVKNAKLDIRVYGNIGGEYPAFKTWFLGFSGSSDISGESVTVSSTPDASLISGHKMYGSGLLASTVITKTDPVLVYTTPNDKTANISLDLCNRNASTSKVKFTVYRGTGSSPLVTDIVHVQMNVPHDSYDQFANKIALNSEVIQNIDCNPGDKIWVKSEVVSSGTSSSSGAGASASEFTQVSTQVPGVISNVSPLPSSVVPNVQTSTSTEPVGWVSPFASLLAATSEKPK